MICVSYKTLLIKAYIFYHKETGRRIIPIENMLIYQKNIEKYFEENKIEAIFEGSIAGAIKENPNLFEFISGDNVIVIKNNVDVDTLINSLDEELTDEVDKAFGEFNIIKQLL